MTLQDLINLTFTHLNQEKLTQNINKKIKNQFKWHKRKQFSCFEVVSVKPYRDPLQIVIKPT